MSASILRHFYKALLWAWISVLGPAPVVAAADSTQKSYGGPFTLVDHTGNTVTDSDFRGEYMLVYFGYTSCPDICPMGLSHIGAAIRQLGEAGRRLRPVFISVDPQRDTVEKLAGYVSAFHPRLIGLTGNRGQVAKAATAYKVDFIISEINGEYLVDHSTYMYLMGPDGKFLARFDHGLNCEELAEALARELTAAADKVEKDT